MDSEIVIVPDPAALAHRAAEIFADSAVEGIASRQRFSVALSGGSTPRAFYGLLAEEPYRERIPWSGVHLFWGDERVAPPDARGSNYRMAQEALLGRVPIPADNVHRISSELEPRVAARAYERQIQEFFCGLRPRFDMVFLGLGRDGHTASLFPGSPFLDEEQRLVVAVKALVQGQPTERVTLTPRATNTARHVLFLVTGESKAEIVQAVLEGARGRYPVQRVRPTAGKLTWLMDQAAASLLERAS